MNFIHDRRRLAAGVALAAWTAALPATAEELAGVATTLPTMVVTASLTPLPAEEAGSAITVITAEEIEEKQVRYVTDVLRDVPGLAVSRSGPVGSQAQIRIRGAEANHTLVYIDGVEVNDPSGASEFQFGDLVASDIERIEVLRGPQSALYGSDAIGGVINIVTKRGAGPATATGSVEGGSFGTGRASASLRAGGADYDVSLGVTTFTTDGVSAAPDGTENDGYDNTTLNARVGFRPLENLSIELSGRYVDSLREFDEANGVVDGVSVLVDTDSTLDSQELNAGGRATLSTFGGMFDHTVGVTVLDSERDTAGGFASTVEGVKTRMYYRGDVFLESDAVLPATHVFSFLAERELESQTVENAFANSDEEVTNHGVAGEYRLGLFDRLFLSAGVRHDFNDSFKDATTTRLTAAYLHRETDTRVHASFGQGVKNPTLVELFGFGLNFVPNGDLEPEKSVGFDIGVEQRFLDGDASVDVTYFENRIEDLIQGAGNTVVNLPGTSKIRGVEATASLRVWDALLLTGQYTLTDARDSEGDRLIRRPRHTASLNASYAFDQDRARINVGADYQGRQDDFAFEAVPPFGTRRVTLDDYVLVNVGASYAITVEVEVFGRVENLIDEDYEDVLGFANPGIGAFVGVRARFGVE
ncbi:MAG: TonB-dependent receptor [Alphaproteobacteria bacterium]